MVIETKNIGHHYNKKPRGLMPILNNNIFKVI
jgi:hypothetical protein